MKIPSICKHFKHSAEFRLVIHEHKKDVEQQEENSSKGIQKGRNLNSMMEQNETLKLQMSRADVKLQMKSSFNATSVPKHPMWVTTPLAHRPSKNCMAAQTLSSIQIYSLKNLSEGLANALTLRMGLNLYPA